jgi:hypothetical protein
VNRFITLTEALKLACPKDKFVNIETWEYRYIIWNTDNNSIPLIAHRTKRLARNELIRLKIKQPKHKFVLLKIEVVL